MEKDSQKLRNRKAVIIQNNKDYPIDKLFITYEGLVRYLDKKLEKQVSYISQGFFDNELMNIMEVIEEICNSIMIDKNYLNRLRQQKTIRKGSYLDKMLDEVVIED
ncbi:MAG: hypothetical protein ACOC1P_01210 [Minisyncoccales bacterium]